MNCNEIIKKIMEADPNQPFSEEIQEHIMNCNKCAQTARETERVIALLQRNNTVDVPPNLPEEIMKSVYCIQEKEGIVPVKEHKMPLFNWIGAGFIILCSIMLLQFSTAFRWVKEAFGGTIEIAIGILLGSAVTIYALVFIATHVKSISDFFGVRDKIINKR